LEIEGKGKVVRWLKKQGIQKQPACEKMMGGLERSSSGTMGEEEIRGVEI